MLFVTLPPAAVQVVSAAVLTSTQPAAVSVAKPMPSGRISVPLFDENHNESAVVAIGLDGKVDAAGAAELRHLFRCKSTGAQAQPDTGLLAMLADVSQHYPGHTIDFVSGYRAGAHESSTSPHRGARALDFRVMGVDLLDVRDYIWVRNREVGVGWYPGQSFVHMDHRGGQPDIAWTELNGANQYTPSWSSRLRAPTWPSERQHHEHRAGI